MALDPEAERLEALDQHPGIERAERGAGVARDPLQLGDDEVPGPQHRAAQGAALAVDVLGGRMHHHISAKLQRPLKDRRGEGVVEHHRGAGLVREVANGLHIDDVEHRVATATRTAPPASASTAPSPTALRSPPSTNSPCDAVLGQQVVHDVVARAEELARRDDAVAGLEQRQQREEHRRHAGRGGAAGLGALERGQPVLEHRDGRIAEARILEVRRSRP